MEQWRNPSVSCALAKQPHPWKSTTRDLNMAFSQLERTRHTCNETHGMLRGHGFYAATATACWI